MKNKAHLPKAVHCVVAGLIPQNSSLILKQIGLLHVLVLSGEKALHIQQKKLDLRDIVWKSVFDFLSEKIGWDKK